MSLLLSFIFDHQCSKVPHFKCSSGIELLYTSEPIITCLFLKRIFRQPISVFFRFFYRYLEPPGTYIQTMWIKKIRWTVRYQNRGWKHHSKCSPNYGVTSIILSVVRSCTNDGDRYSDKFSRITNTFSQGGGGGSGASRAGYIDQGYLNSWIACTFIGLFVPKYLLNTQYCWRSPGQFG